MSSDPTHAATADDRSPAGPADVSVASHDDDIRS
jgi:hypothetical protein